MINDVFEAIVFFVYGTIFLLMALESDKLRKEEADSRTISGDIQRYSYRIVALVCSVLSVVGFYCGIVNIGRALTGV